MIAETEWIAVINRLVGKPFEWNARGPDSFDCWGLVIEARRSLGLATPAVWSAWGVDNDSEDAMAKSSCIVIDEHFTRPTWKKVSTGSPGDIVAMSKHRLIHHVGLLTPYGVLNTARGLGATVDSLHRLRDVGFKRIEFFQWVE
jgi:cell wall-associated NlpC family hydrolase